MESEPLGNFSVPDVTTVLFAIDVLSNLPYAQISDLAERYQRYVKFFQESFCTGCAEKLCIY